MSISYLDIQCVYGVEWRAEYRSHSSKFKINVFECCVSIPYLIINVCIALNAELYVYFLPQFQSVYGVKCRAERRSQNLMFKMNIFECRAESRTHSSIFVVCMVLNTELNIDPTAR